MSDLDAVTALLAVETPERAAELSKPEALLGGALSYARIGWPVFPLKPGGKTPIVEHWREQASTDENVVRAWWAATPHANIGAPTGLRFDVVDIDAPAGYESWQHLRAGWLESGASVNLLGCTATGGGGRHLLVEANPFAPNGANFLPGLDYRGLGGYVVLPPSRLHAGDRYVWTLPPRAAITGGAA